MSANAPDMETAIIGGGIVGLAIAAECARQGQDVYLLERNAALGQETSSRSSEVIHAGIYYPKGSLKARLCIDGRNRLYAYAREHDVGFKKLGKLIVATSEDEVPTLDVIASKAKQNGVDDLAVLSRSDAHALEPEIAAVKALFSPSTGIIDSHEFTLALERDLIDHGGTIARSTNIQSVSQRPDGIFEMSMTTGGQNTTMTARNLIVAAGLGMAELGNKLPHAPSYQPPQLFFAKGHYFALNRATPFRHLVYPVPVEGGLGTHLTLDMEGNARFGPDVLWIDRVDYAFEEDNGLRREEFERSIRRYWPSIAEGALVPSYTGIRPKISRQGEPARDFAIHGPRDHGIQGLVALYGIESPGLTSSLAIANYCNTHVRQAL
ncbi:FAD-dependent oxidoreductase [Hyphomicrobium methylovorum]|uniref:NAD(P)/FAD-dependent oxidoreductase n=1 Tax=Hyphomicrobium methylovorum TaxID=84 RepID=UPI0015E76EDA|nr:NAD(P)/FAD-dependent oxidoreductase [Hyphomicrobium methylovorum]MBA2127594.1 FAD-dependent oxidoreductase [Hyphomicrobium methylovorum]